MIDPTLAELSYAALTDWRACGPLGDWLEERGHAGPACEARKGLVFVALFDIDKHTDFYAWLDVRDPERTYRESREYPPDERARKRKSEILGKTI